MARARRRKEVDNLNNFQGSRTANATAAAAEARKRKQEQRKALLLQRKAASKAKMGIISIFLEEFRSELQL